MKVAFINLLFCLHIRNLLSYLFSLAFKEWSFFTSKWPRNMPELREYHYFLFTTNELLQWYLGRGFTEPEFEIYHLQLLKKAPWKALKKGPWSSPESIRTFLKQGFPHPFLKRASPQILCIRQEEFVNKLPLALL